MAKRSFDIGKLVKASHKQMCYEQQGDCVCLSDKRGRIAVQTNDITVLGELVKRGVELTERLGLKQTIDQIMNKDRAENLYSYTATGIQFPYYDHSDGSLDHVSGLPAGLLCCKTGRQSLYGDF